MPSILDRFDLKLLDLVQRDNRLTGETLGDRVGLSATAVQRRLKRLREVETHDWVMPNPLAIPVGTL